MARPGNSMDEEEKQFIKTLVQQQDGLNHQEILHFLSRLCGDLYNSGRVTEIENDQTIHPMSDGELSRYIFENLPQ